MEQPRDAGKAPDQSSQVQTGNKAASKKPYVAPVLIEYGTIAKLTQGAKTRSNDGSNTRKLMACL